VKELEREIFINLIFNKLTHNLAINNGTTASLLLNITSCVLNKLNPTKSGFHLIIRVAFG